MSERRLLFIRISLFLLMLLCFSLQSLDNFEKYLEGKTSISESEIPKPALALPTFSVCSEPSFDAAFMKKYNISPNLFLGSYRISFLSDNYQFPALRAGLDSDVINGLTLQNYWSANALSPFKFSIGKDTLELTDISGYDTTDVSNFTEIKSIEHINSLSFGSCTSFVLNKQRDTNQILLLGFEYPR